MNPFLLTVHEVRRLQFTFRHMGEGTAGDRSFTELDIIARLVNAPDGVTVAEAVLYAINHGVPSDISDDSLVDEVLARQEARDGDR